MVELTSSLRFTFGTRLRELWRKKFVRDAFGLSMGKGLNLSMGMLSTLIFGIVFAKTDIAMVSLFEMLVQMVLAFGVTWSAAGVTRFGRQELNEGACLNYTASTRLAIVFPIVTVSVCLLLLFQRQVLAYIGTDQTILIWYLIGWLLVSAANELISTLLATREKHLKNAIFHVAEGAAKLLVLSLFFFGWVKADVVTYLATGFWLNVVILALRIPSCGRDFLYPVRYVDRKDLRVFLKYIIPQIYGFVGLFVVNWIDVYFIRKYCAMEDLGAYQFLYSIFVKFSAFAIVAHALLFPRVMAWKLENPEAVESFVRRVPQLVFGVAIASCLALVLLFPSVFSLFFGSKYEVAYPSFVLMLAALPCYFLSHLLIPVLNSYDRVKYIQSVNILSAGSNLLIDYMLVSRYGIIGAAFGTFVAYWLKIVLLMVPVRAMFPLRADLLLTMSLVLAVAVVVYFMWVQGLWFVHDSAALGTPRPATLACY